MSTDWYASDLASARWIRTRNAIVGRKLSVDLPSHRLPRAAVDSNRSLPVRGYGYGKTTAAAADGAITTGLDATVRYSYHHGMKTTVSEKGQITIPKRLRDRLGLRPGTILDFEEASGRLVGRKLVPADHLDDLVGILTLPKGGTDAFIRDVRGPGPEPDVRGSEPDEQRG